MTRLVNDPVNFPVELVDGFVKANSKYVKKSLWWSSSCH